MKKKTVCGILLFLSIVTGCSAQNNRIEHSVKHEKEPSIKTYEAKKGAHFSSTKVKKGHLQLGKRKYFIQAVIPGTEWQNFATKKELLEVLPKVTEEEFHMVTSWIQNATFRKTYFFGQEASIQEEYLALGYKDRFGFCREEFTPVGGGKIVYINNDGEAYIANIPKLCSYIEKLCQKKIFSIRKISDRAMGKITFFREKKEKRKSRSHTRKMTSEEVKTLNMVLRTGKAISRTESRKRFSVASGVRIQYQNETETYEMMLPLSGKNRICRNEIWVEGKRYTVDQRHVSGMQSLIKIKKGRLK